MLCKPMHLCALLGIFEQQLFKDTYPGDVDGTPL